MLIDWTVRTSYVSTQKNTERATIKMTHDNVNLSVSADEALKVEEEAKRRLITAKKLSLVVDLDQTIIQATVDPTIAEWQKDPDHPNHDSVKEVKAFQLEDESPGARGCWYYIKFRPGLKEFLENVSQIYELHIYTMGTRAYAQQIANLIDPDRKIFGDRILSRDESGSLVAKNLQRLFPTDTKMVVIIDDRGDVWKWNENLVKVTPYDFFVGIGDINSSFLPKLPARIPILPDAPPNPNKDLALGATKKEPEPKVNGDDAQPENVNSTSTHEINGTSTLAQLVSMGGGDDPSLLEEQTNQQGAALATQLQERPLLQKQLLLEAEEAKAASSSGSEAAETNGTSSPPNAAVLPERPRHKLLQDNDTELTHLEHALRKVHTEFYDAYTRSLADNQGGRLAQLRGAGGRRQPASANRDLELIPDIKLIMPAIKSRVLAGLVLVFSGVVPLGVDVHTADITHWARSFGATVEIDINRKRTTHLVAARNRTAKVRKAVRLGKGRIKVVNTRWLLDCIVQWTHLDETPYLLKTGQADVGRPAPGEEDDALSGSESLGGDSGLETDAPDTDGEKSALGTDRKMPSRLKLKVGVPPPPPSQTASEANTEELDGDLHEEWVDQKSPVGGSHENWDDMEDEMAEFLGSEAGDSDAESVGSVDPTMAGVTGRAKRKRRDEESDNEDGHGEGDKMEERGGGAPAPAKKMRSSSTILSEMEAVVNGVEEEDEDENEDPEGMVNGEGDAEDAARREGDEDDGEEGEEGSFHDGWSEFDGDHEAEIERAVSEDKG